MKLDLYYVDLNDCLGQNFSEYEYDENGNPLTRYYCQANWNHNPVTVCQYGLYQFNNFLKTQVSEARKNFLAQADWLLRHAQEGANNSVVWHYLFDLLHYNLASPWFSGMAQGQALSVLLRAHQITRNNDYLNIAHHAWKSFEFSVSEGGVIAIFPDGKSLIEEYPSAYQVTAVLNGFIFGIFGVYDYAIYTENQSAKKIFEVLVDSLKCNLFRYDTGYWTYYDLADPLRLTSKTYHRLHVCQLKKMYQITQDELFLTYYQRWESYLSSFKSNYKWLMKKVHQKLILRI